MGKVKMWATGLGITPYAYNSSNQLTSTPNVTFTYDDNGNTLTKSDPNGTTAYTWDYENRLTSATLPNNGGVVTFKYDPFGRRIQKSGPSGTVNYVYDGANVVEEFNALGTATSRYVQGAGIDEPLAQSSSGLYFYEADGLGSITALTDANGVTTATYAYDAFGNLTTSTGAVTNPYRYTGREYDAETSLYYYRARYYDPAIGRFISEDPLGFDADGNFYRYAKDDPTRYRDPSGKCIIELYIVPTGQHNEGTFYHSFLVLYDNSPTAPKGNPARIFRGGPGPGVDVRPVLEAGFGPLTADSVDQPSDAFSTTTLLNNQCSCDSYMRTLNDFVSKIENANIPYGPTRNSNSVTSSAINLLGLKEPKIPLADRKFLLGWGTRVP